MQGIFHNEGVLGFLEIEAWVFSLVVLRRCAKAELRLIMRGCKRNTETSEAK